MSQLQRAGQSGALDVAANQGAAAEQIATLVDMLRQIGGNARVVAGSSLPADPLSAPFTLYVNPYTGSDRFIGGAYNSHEATGTDEEIIAQKLRRIELQRLECGYTPYRPFRTINRAVIEAAIITSKSWYTYTDPRAHVDCVSIVLSTGVHTLHNNPGSASTSLASWGTSKDPTIAELINFNPASVGGVLLPRGCSLCGPDLRKTTIRPTFVPPVADEAADYSNRRAMLKITGTGYFFGFTLMDQIGENRSHHLLDPFHFASKTELDAFYAKCLSTVGSGADLGSALLVTRSTETEIVGPIETTQGPTPAWDTTASASPYIFNVSVRSDYGMGGAFMDGSKVTGLKSMVCANFTGVSLQKDMSCWQRYSGGSWTTTNYAQYISTSPDNIRMNPARLSRHITAINDAFIQEVSVFAIGHGIHHFTDRGGEITVTNSNSSFGGNAALSKGYKSAAFPQDKNWTVSRIKVPLDIGAKTGNVRRIFLGAIGSINSSRILLTDQLVPSDSNPSVPAILDRDGYSLKTNTLIWIENPLGDDWKATIPAGAWSGSNPTRINVQSLDSGALDTIVILDENNQQVNKQAAAGKRVYVRRVVDTRTPGERQVSMLLENTTAARLPERNFILQTDPSNQFITASLASTGESVLVVSNAGASPSSTGANISTEITIRRGSPSKSYSQGAFYRKGTVVRYSGKHYVTGRDVVATASIPDSQSWSETYVHMESGYDPEDPASNEGLTLTIDTDTDTSPITTTCGIPWATAYTSVPEVRDQYRTSTDYLGVYAFLRALGFTDSAAHAALVPQASTARTRDTNSAVDFPTAPSGGVATGRGYWGVELRRPSVLRLFGHAWEWAGFLNYSKSIPAAQKTLSPQNKFTYYFTNQNGGRVVPQGSNEDGFNITPRGLEDVETGSTLTVENLVGGSIDQRQQTSFQSLDVQNLTVNNLTLTGTLSGFDTGISDAKTDSPGLAKLAKANLLRAIPGSENFRTVTGDNDTERNASIDQGVDNGIVTIGSLNYWRLSNNLLSGATDTVRIYVDPIDGVDTSLNQMNEEPPTLPSRKVKTLRRAVEWANASFGPSVTVEYRIGAGVYVESGTITFKTVAIIRAWDYSADGYLNDSQAGGSKPFMGQEASGKTWAQNRSYFINTSNHPIFLTRPSVTTGLDSTITTGSNVAGRLINTPLLLRFERDGSVTGVVWWGPIETIVAAESVVPNSFFQSDVNASTYRDPSRSDRDNALNRMLRDILATLSYNTSAGIRLVETRQCIEFLAQGDIANVTFGAMGTVYENTRSAAQYGLVFCGGAPVRARGMWFIGNLRIDNDLGSTAPNFLGQSTYRYTGFAQNIFTIDRLGTSTNESIVLNFNGFRQEFLADYNFTWNNFHLVNNDFKYTRSAGQSMQGSSEEVANSLGVSGNDWQKHGPAIGGLFGRALSISTTNGIHLHEGLSPTQSNTQGWVGKFGNYANGSASSPQKSKGILAVVNNFQIGNGNPAFFLKPAAVSQTDVDAFVPIPANPGEVGDRVLYDKLNIEIRGIRRGINIGVYYGVGSGGANVTVNPFPTQIQSDARL